MASNASKPLDRFRALWRSLAADFQVHEPTVTPLDDWRTEFDWRGLPLTFDRRRNEVLRGGRVVAKSADIESVDITHVRDDEAPDYWKVSFSTGMFSSVEIGRTGDDVEAAIAAARVSTLAGVKVRAQSVRRR